MTITTFGGGGMVITGKQDIDAYAKLARLGMLRLEARGMFGSGGGAYRWVKARYGLKGNKKSVLVQYEAILEQEGVLKRP